MKTAFAVIVVFVLAACSQTPSGGTGMASAAARAADATTTLTQYHWQLVNAVDRSGQRIDALFARATKPLQLDFGAHGVSISDTCNRMRGSYSVAGGKLTLGNLASTLMACSDPALAALDSAAGKTLQGTFTLVLDVHGRQPKLTLSVAGGNKLTFTGTPTDATRHGGEGETLFLEIGPQTKPCPAPADSQCLYVRELHYGADGARTTQPGDWHVLAQNIEGYTHAPSVHNVLRVKRYKIANPSADAPSTAYVLDMVVETALPPRAS